MKEFTDFSGDQIVSRFRERGDSLVETASQAFKACEGHLEEVRRDAGICQHHMIGMRVGLAPGSPLSCLADTVRETNRTEETARRELLERAFSTFASGVQEARALTGQVLDATKSLEVHVQGSVEVAESAMKTIIALDGAFSRENDQGQCLRRALERLRAITGNQD